MGEIFQQAISLTSSFNLWLILTIFAITIVAEFGFSIPYLLESIWLLTGYHAVGGIISFEAVLAFCAISLIGRVIGAVALYKISGYGKAPLLRLFYYLVGGPNGPPSGNALKRRALAPIARFAAQRFAPHLHHKGHGKSEKTGFGSRLLRPSAFNIALGRFAWLKIPITVTMGMTRKPMALLAGVALFSLAWDGLYITLGIFGGGGRISPFTMIICTLSALIVINITIHMVRRFLSARSLPDTGA